MREAALIRKIKDHVESMGGMCIKYYGGSGFALQGMTDLILVTKKFGVLFIETKAPGKRPTPLQEAVMLQINQAGGRAIWCDSMPMFLDFLKFLEMEEPVDKTLDRNNDLC
jgi:hypothetical protein